MSAQQESAHVSGRPVKGKGSIIEMNEAARKQVYDQIVTFRDAMQVAVETARNLLDRDYNTNIIAVMWVEKISKLQGEAELWSYFLESNLFLFDEDEETLGRAAP